MRSIQVKAEIVNCQIKKILWRNDAIYQYFYEIIMKLIKVFKENFLENLR